MRRIGFRYWDSNLFVIVNIFCKVGDVDVSDFFFFFFDFVLSSITWRPTNAGASFVVNVLVCVWGWITADVASSLSLDVLLVLSVSSCNTFDDTLRRDCCWWVCTFFFDTLIRDDDEQSLTNVIEEVVFVDTSLLLIVARRRRINLYTNILLKINLHELFNDKWELRLSIKIDRKYVSDIEIRYLEDTWMINGNIRSRSSR